MRSNSATALAQSDLPRRQPVHMPGSGPNLKPDLRSLAHFACRNFSVAHVLRCAVILRGRDAFWGLGMISIKVVVAAGQLLLPVAEYDALDEPIWCAKRDGLVAQISGLGGQAVKRVYVGDGRTVEWFWNDREELIIEHNPGGDSCLLRLRTPGR